VDLQGDLARATIDAKDRALLALAETLTLDPSASPERVRAAVRAGWSHEQVADAIFVVSVFNMMTRIADAFALPPDASHPFPANAKLPMRRCTGSPGL